MSDAKRTKDYIVFKLRKNYREGKLDTSQVARLKAIGFDFDGAVFNASKDSLAVQYPAIAEEWDKERNGEQTPWKVRPLATKKAWWRCPHCDRPYRLAIRSRSSATADALTVDMAENVQQFLFRSSGWIR